MSYDPEKGFSPDPCPSCGVPLWGHSYCETPGCPYEHWTTGEGIPHEDMETLSVREIARKYGVRAHYWPIKPETDAHGIWRVSTAHLDKRDRFKLREGAKVNWCREVMEPRTYKGRSMQPSHHGYMVWAPAKENVYGDQTEALRVSGFSEAFIHILEIAERSGCLAVHFDPDAEPHPRLTQF